MDSNPVLWLLSRERWQAASVWVLTILALLTFVAAGLQGHGAGWFAWSAGAGLFTLLFYLGLASQAGRFFVEGRRNGFLELLLGTPCRAELVVRGQLRALLRMFGLPLSLFLVAQLLGSILAQQATANLVAAPPTRPPPVAVAATPTGGSTNSAVVARTNTVAPARPVRISSPYGQSNLAVTVVQSAASVLATVVSLVALAWFGMWMGLTSKSVNLATLKTILYVQVIPWFIISFLSALLVPLFLVRHLSGGSAQFAGWVPLIMGGASLLLSLCKDLVFLFWARGRLRSRFRERVTSIYGSTQTASSKSVRSQ
jgi:hypothetical protein